MTNDISLLVVEDNPKHLADAQRETERYRGIHFNFAQTFEEAKALVDTKSPHSAIIDVFFPIERGGEPDYHSAIRLAKYVDSRMIPFVYNTAGNHHGLKYREFAKERYSDEGFRVRGRSSFTTGQLIESYPEDSNGELDFKQWTAAINIAILLANMNKIGDDTKSAVGRILQYAHLNDVGDKGRLTESLEHILGNFTIMELGDPAPWYQNAFRQGRDEGFVGEPKMDNEKGQFVWDHFRDEKGQFVSLRTTKEEDERRFREVEQKWKQEYEKGLEFIRSTIRNYRIK
jgi:hypothetical protein